MSASLRFTFIFAAILASVSACTSNPEGTGTRTFQIPWPTSDGSYQLQNVEIESFDEARSLKGKYAEILVEPTESTGSISGYKSVGRFSKSHDGVLVPLDFNTLQATTIYAHMERLAKLDAVLGIDAAGIWPARVGVAVNYPDGDGALIKDQAYFIPDLNSIIFVPYTNSHLPISMNGGIIAHEHFHQIFQRFVTAKVDAKERGRSRASTRVHVCAFSGNVPQLDKQIFDTEDPAKTSTTTNREYNEFLLRSLNEGLADFYGWLYTGDAKFISQSMHNIGQDRSLDNHFEPLATIEQGVHEIEVVKQLSAITAHKKFKGALISRSYVWGSRYAKFLRSVVKARGSEEASRVEFARALLRVLSKLGDEFDTKFESEKVDPDFVVRNLFEELNESQAEACALYNEFVSDSRPRPQGCAK